MRMLPPMIAITLIACGGAEPTNESTNATINEATPPSRTDEATSSTPVAPPHCMPAGLENAHSLPLITLVAGCSLVAAGTLEAPLLIANEADFATHLHCDGATIPTVDFAVNDVWLASYTASPAHGGSAVLDDGARVSFVTMQRTPCPTDFPPMPTPMSIAFMLPKGATRTWGTATCTLAPQCPDGSDPTR